MRRIQPNSRFVVSGGWPPTCPFRSDGWPPEDLDDAIVAHVIPRVVLLRYLSANMDFGSRPQNRIDTLSQSTEDFGMSRGFLPVGGWRPVTKVRVNPGFEASDEDGKLMAGSAMP